MIGGGGSSLPSYSSYSSLQSSLYEQSIRADDNAMKKLTSYCAQLFEEFHFRKFTLGGKRSRNVLFTAVWFFEMLQLFLLHSGSALLPSNSEGLSRSNLQFGVTMSLFVEGPAVSTQAWLINFGVMAGFLLLFLGLMLALVLRNKGQMSSSDIPNFVFTTLWLLMAICLELLAIPSLGSFLVWSKCSTSSVTGDLISSSKFIDHGTSESKCLGMPNLIFIGVGALMVLLLVVLVVIVRAAFSIGRGSITCWYDRLLGRVDVIIFLDKLVLVALTMVVESRLFVGLAGLLSAAGLVVYLGWSVSYKKPVMNSVRVAEFVTCALASAACLISVGAGDSSAGIIYTIFWVLTIPSMIVFPILYLRIRERMIPTEEGIVSHFGMGDEVFFYVPSLSRKADVIPTLNFLCAGDYSDANNSRMGEIFRIATKKYPTMGSILILHADYLLCRASVDMDLLESSKILSLLRKVSEGEFDETWLDWRIILTTLHRMRRDLESNDGSEGGRLLREAVKVSSRIHGLMKGFWRALLKTSNEKISLLPAFISSIEKEESRADSLFSRLIETDSKNPQALRAYATFQETIKFNKWEAARYYMLSDQVEEQRLRAKRKREKHRRKRNQKLIQEAGDQSVDPMALPEDQSMMFGREYGSAWGDASTGVDPWRLIPSGVSGIEDSSEIPAGGGFLSGLRAFPGDQQLSVYSQTFNNNSLSTASSQSRMNLLDGAAERSSSVAGGSTDIARHETLLMDPEAGSFVQRRGSRSLSIATSDFLDTTSTPLPNAVLPTFVATADVHNSDSVILRAHQHHHNRLAGGLPSAGKQSALTPVGAGQGILLARDATDMSDQGGRTSPSRNSTISNGNRNPVDTTKGSIPRRSSTVRSLASSTGGGGASEVGAESEAGYTEGTKMSGTSFPMDDSEIAERSAKFRSGSVQRLWLSVILSLVVLMGCLIGLYVVGDNVLATHVTGAQLVVDSGGTREFSQDMVKLARRLQLIYSGKATGNTTLVNQQLLEVTEKIEANVHDVFSRAVASGDAKVINAFNAVIPVNNYEPAVDANTVANLDLMNLYLTFIRKTRALAVDSNQQATINDYMKSNNFRFIVENGPDIFLDNIWILVGAFQTSYQQGTETRETLILIMMGVGFAVPILLAVALFIPSVFSIRREKSAILKLFLLIPKSDVSKTLHRLQKQRAVQATSMKRSASAETLSEEETTDAEKPDGKKAGDDSEMGSRRSRLSLQREKKFEVAAVHNKGWTLVKKMTVSFFVTLTIVLGLLTGMLLVTLLTTRSYSGRAPLLNYADARLSAAVRAVMWCGEILSDEFPFRTPEQLRTSLDQTATNLRAYHQAVKFGDSSLGIPASVGQDPEQDRLIYRRRCDDLSSITCLSLDATVSRYIELIRRVTSIPQSSISLGFSTIQEIEFLQENHLTPLLRESKLLYFESAAPVITLARTQVQVFLGLGLAVIILSYLLVMHSQLLGLGNEIARTRKMLLMLPMKAIHDQPQIHAFLTRGVNSESADVETSLLESEERTQSVLAATTDACFVLNEEGLIELANNTAERMLMKSQGQVAGKHIADLLAARDSQAMYSALEGLRHTKKIKEKVALEANAVRSDGSVFPVQVSLCMGQVRGKFLFSVFVRDNTVEKLQKKLLEEEKQHSETLLLNILPRSIATRLKNGEHPIADGFEAVTVVFIDMVGFTTMSSGLAPAELVKFLNEFFSIFDELASLHHIEKIKTIGDCFMGVGGLFDRHHDHAQAVVQFGLDIHHCVEAIRKRSGFDISVRVGINTGPVVAGVIGYSKYAFDLWGDAVNVASRMESNSLPGRVQISRSTYERVYNDFECEERGEMEIKGKGAMLTYLVVDKRSPDEVPEMCRLAMKNIAGFEEVAAEGVTADGPLLETTVMTSPVLHSENSNGSPVLSPTRHMEGSNPSSMGAGPPPPPPAAAAAAAAAATVGVVSSLSNEGEKPGRLVSQDTSNSLQAHFTRVQSLEKEAMQHMLPSENP